MVTIHRLQAAKISEVKNTKSQILKNRNLQVGSIDPSSHPNQRKHTNKMFQTRQSIVMQGPESRMWRLLDLHDRYLMCDSDSNCGCCAAQLILDSRTVLDWAHSRLVCDSPYVHMTQQPALCISSRA
jgi:hypothetical protein